MAKYRIVTLQQGQSILDLSIQEYGCVEGLFVLIDDNSFIADFTQYIAHGTDFKIQTVVPKLTDTNVSVVLQYKKDATTVANGVDPLASLSYRILENEDVRLLENGDFRILE